MHAPSGVTCFMHLPNVSKDFLKAHLYGNRLKRLRINIYNFFVRRYLCYCYSTSLSAIHLRSNTRETFLFYIRFLFDELWKLSYLWNTIMSQGTWSSALCQSLYSLHVQERSVKSYCILFAVNSKEQTREILLQHTSNLRLSISYLHLRQCNGNFRYKNASM